MLLCLYKRSGQVKSLKTDEADEIFNVTGNKTNSITGIFSLKYYLDLELLQLYSREIFSENFLILFLQNTLNGWSSRKELRPDSECLGKNNFV